MRYLFSVVILLHNEEKTIGTILHHLAKASLDYNIEVIIIDSESTDRSLAIVKKFEKKLHLKTIPIKKNVFNYGATRNKAVEYATGTYICFLSADIKILTTDFFKYFHEDFKISKRVVAVFGKQIPYTSTPFLQKLEIILRYKKLDSYTNKKGLFIQSKNILSFTKDDSYFSYFLFNPFSCYRSSFLKKNKFPKSMYGEDIEMGKKIIEKNLVKIYDSRCIVRHSNSLTFFDYYNKQKEEIKLRLKIAKGQNKTYFLEKLQLTFMYKENLLLKAGHSLEIFFFYFLKSLAYIDVKLNISHE